MDRIINLNLMKNPFNWVILYLMVALAALAIRYIVPAPNASSDNGDASSNPGASIGTPQAVLGLATGLPFGIVPYHN